MPSSDPILDAWSELVACAPRRCVIVSPGREERTATATEIDRITVRLMERLDGLRSAQPVALSVPNGPLFFAAFLAVRRLGHVAVMLDASAPFSAGSKDAARLGARLLLSSDSGWSDASQARLDSLDPPQGDSRPSAPPGTALIKLTSGSTGEAQGVAVSAANLIADDHNLSSTMRVSPDDRILAAIPLSHSYGFSSVALPCLLRGTRLIVPPEGQPLGGLAAARKGDATFLPTVPSFVEALVRTERPPPLPTSLRLVIAAGSALSTSTARRFADLYDHPVQPFYGASECGGIAFDRDGSAGLVGALGPPVDGVDITLLPEDRSPELAFGDRPSFGHRAGIVEVASAAVALQYLPVPSDALAGGRYRTSDRGVIENGVLRLLGRVDAVVNVRGLKVHPAEVEAVLLEMAEIREAAVFGVDGPSGTSLRAVVAIETAEPSDAEIRQWCLQRLPRHKVPRHIVRAGQLPRTARGKLDRSALLELASTEEPADGPPDPRRRR